MSNGVIILLFFIAICGVPLCIVFLVLSGAKRRHMRKQARYQGFVEGQLTRIKRGGLDHPDVLYVSYTVGGVDYQVKETAKKQSKPIYWGKIPVGQRKTYRLGAVGEGDVLTVQYDEEKPQHALIVGNDGVRTN